MTGSVSSIPPPLFVDREVPFEPLADRLEPASEHPPPFHAHAPREAPAYEHAAPGSRWATWHVVAAGVGLGLLVAVAVVVPLTLRDGAAASAHAPKELATAAAAPETDSSDADENPAAERALAHDPLLRIGTPPEWVAHTVRPRRIRQAREAVQRAHRYNARGDLPSAEAWLRRANHLHPEHAATASLLARNLEAQGRHDEAQAWAAHSIELAPRVAYPYYHQGRVHESQANDPSALDSYHEALDRNPRERRTLRRVRALDDER